MSLIFFCRKMKLLVVLFLAIALTKAHHPKEVPIKGK